MIMEGIITEKVTPLLKFFVLFLFIFTAKVLTSRPHESQDTRNGIHHVKPSHYVRTFTKYHHRRTIQWNQDNYWPLAHEQKEKRDIDFPNWPETNDDPVSSNNNERKKRNVPDSNEYVDKDNFNSDLRENLANIDKNAINLGKVNLTSKNGIPVEVSKYKVKAAIIVTEAPTTMGPTISCLYKIHSVSMSPTPTYTDDKQAQLTVESDTFERGSVSEEVLPSGPTLVEKCMHPRATCYTLYQEKQGNVTVLGQGCWKAAASQTEGQSVCDKCTRVTARPDTKFCCCTNSYCNADFMSLKEELVTIKAESTMKVTETDSWWVWYKCVFPVAAVAAVAMIASAYCDAHCHRAHDTTDTEKGEVMGSGPDSLATGLSCVDNLTLIEHIGQGKFGTVWRGTLGSTPVAVKLYTNASAWHKEASVYALPHLSHPNILRYYGSETRPTITDGGREHLVVLELCAGTLRSRLQSAPLSWRDFAALAHGIAAALAHLHTPSGNKPCIVHRDVNSNNVLVTASGCARLADLGLATLLQPRQRALPTRITEAGTLRYLAPEALDGALDLSGAGAALCAVDVYALGLVLWEMLWRTKGAHAGPVPPYKLPYENRGLPARPTLNMMQTLVSRNKVRPPLPRGPVADARPARLAAETCDECWDQDAEARLTAVCVEERMNELKQLVNTQPPHIHDNMLHPHVPHTELEQIEEKNSNCEADPLLLPRPQLGRNACIERNTHITQQHTVQLIHKSLKDITIPTMPLQPRVQNEENCLSVARITNRIPIPENSLNEIRSYPRPLDYVPNDVSSHDTERTKDTNLLQNVKTEKPKSGLRRFFEKFNRKVDTEVKLVPESSQRTKTSVVNEKPINTVYERPSNLVLDADRNFSFEAPCLSPPNRTLSPTMNENVLGFRELPSRDDPINQIFAVIVPKQIPSELQKSKGSSESINKQSVRTSMSSQSMFKSNSESEDSTLKKRLSCEKITNITNSASSSRASINLELQYIDNPENLATSPFDNSDCSSSEDEHLMLLSENGVSKITMQSVPKTDILKESSQTKAITFNKLQNKYTNFDNEFSDPNDKENVNYTVDNPVYLAAFNDDTMYQTPKSCLKSVSVKRQHSLEQVSELFTSSGEVNLLNPAGRVKTPGDLPVAVRRARRDRALQKGRANETNRLSLYDDRMMFGNSL